MLTEKTEIAQVELRFDINGFLATIFIEAETIVYRDNIPISKSNHRTPVEPSSVESLNVISRAILRSNIDVDKLASTISSMREGFIKPTRYQSVEPEL